MDLVNQRTQTLSNLEVDRANHPTVGSAVEPLVPVNGNAKRSGAIGLVVGTLLAAGLAYARASRRRCLADRDDPAAIYDAPLIGEIPSPSRAAFCAAVRAAGPLPVAADPQSPAAEAFRFTAGYVERIRAARGDRLAVVFVSSESGGDRSMVVANLALAVAESGTSVLAVDADSSEGVLTALLLPGSPQADGFDQVIAGRRHRPGLHRDQPAQRGCHRAPGRPDVRRADHRYGVRDRGREGHRRGEGVLRAWS